MRSRLVNVLVGSGLAAAGAAFPAHASAPVKAGSIRFSISLSTDRLQYGSNATLYIRMQTGAHGQTAGIGLNSSAWPDRNVLGSPIALGRPRISGPGQITGSWAASGGGYGHMPLCVRGPLDNGFGGPSVSLPANSVSVLAYSVRLAAPPWPGLRATVAVSAYVPAMGHASRAYQLGSRRLRTVGHTGVRISLAAHGARVNRSGDVVVQHDTHVLITGQTAPRIPGARLRIFADTYRTQGSHLTRLSIGSAVSSGDGSFDIRWLPPSTGTYMIVAHLHHPGPSYLPDRGCDLSIAVR